MSLSDLMPLHIAPEAPPDAPGAPEKPLVVTAGDGAGHVLTWTVADGRPLGQPGVSAEEAAGCFKKARVYFAAVLL